MIIGLSNKLRLLVTKKQLLFLFRFRCLHNAKAQIFNVNDTMP